MFKRPNVHTPKYFSGKRPRSKSRRLKLELEETDKLNLTELNRSRKLGLRRKSQSKTPRMRKQMASSVSPWRNTGQARRSPPKSTGNKKKQMFLFPISQKVVTPSLNANSISRLLRKPPPEPPKRSYSRQFQGHRKLSATTPTAATTHELTTPKNNKPNLQKFVTKVSQPVRQVNAPTSEQMYHEHLYQTFMALKFISTLSWTTPDDLEYKWFVLPRKTNHKKLVIFDLDETLVHWCDEESRSPPEVNLIIKFPTGEQVQAGINIRPYAIECLREANKWYEVVVFTASHQWYADVVLDYIDPKKELVMHRLYRDNCVNVEGVFIKDLRVIQNWDLKDILIIDNSAYSFGFQLNNGVPIISWHDDKNDRELFNLIDYMQRLADVDDIRIENENNFHLPTFYEDYAQDFEDVPNPN